VPPAPPDVDEALFSVARLLNIAIRAGRRMHSSFFAARSIASMPASSPSLAQGVAFVDFGVARRVACEVSIVSTTVSRLRFFAPSSCARLRLVQTLGFLERRV